jgi:hypothetical protein
MKIHLLLVPLLGLFLCGCKTAPNSHTQTTPVVVISDTPPPAGAAVKTIPPAKKQGAPGRKASYPGIPQPEPNAVVVQEQSRVFYKGEPRTISPDAYQPRVDYASELRLIVNTNELNKQIGRTPSILPTLSAEQKNRLVALQQVLATGKQYMRDFADYTKQYERYKNSKLDRATISLLKKAINKQGASGQQWIDSLIIYLQAKIAAEDPQATKRESLARLDELSYPIIHEGTNVVPLNLPALTDFLAAESATVINQALADTKTVRNSGTVSFRLRATVIRPGQSPQAIHIRNYDTLSDADVVQEPRITYKMSDEDRQRLEAETKVNTELAQLIKDIQNSNSDIRKSFDSIVSALRQDLGDWKNAVSDLDKFKASFDPLIAAAVSSVANPGLAPSEAKLLTDVTNLLTSATNQIGQVRQAIATFTQTSTAVTDPAAALMSAADAFSTTLSTFAALPDTIKTNFETCYQDLTNLTAELKKSLPPKDAAVAPVIQALETALPATATAVTNFISTNLTAYPNLIAELKGLVGRGYMLSTEAKLSPIAVDPTLLDLPIESPPDGFISLQRNIPKGELVLALDGSLVSRKDSTSPPESTSVEHQEFDVEKCGLVNTWSANLIFTKRLGNIPPGERKQDFTPAPSISWTLHYTFPPSDTPPNPWWENIYPGAGVNIAALNWDNSVQIGLGGHVSFFHDILLAGAGYNLQASSHGGYFFVGIGLFQALNRLGLPTPPGTSP